MEGAAIRVTVSVRREPLPPPGATPRRFARDDLLGAAPPRDPPPAQYVVRHGLDESPDAEARLEYATVVEAGAEGVRVDERIGVEPRVLTGVLRAEARVRRSLDKGSAASTRVVEGTSSAVAARVGGRSGQAVAAGGGLMSRALRWTFGSLRDGLRALAQAPDLLVAGAGTAGSHLRAPRGRRALLRGLLDPYSLTREGKAAALFLAGAGTALLLVGVTVAVALVRPQWAEGWQDVFGAFLLALASTVLLPTFPELRLKFLASSVGAPLAILTMVAAMTLGAWLVLFAGDAAHAGLRRSLRPDSRLARLLDRAEAFAARRGFWTAFLILAIPLGPDTPVFYVLATVRTPVRQYILGVVLGTLVRFTLWLALPMLHDEILS